MWFLLLTASHTSIKPKLSRTFSLAHVPAANMELTLPLPASRGHSRCLCSILGRISWQPSFIYSTVLCLFRFIAFLSFVSEKCYCAPDFLLLRLLPLVVRPSSHSGILSFRESSEALTPGGPTARSRKLPSPQSLVKS